MPKILFTVFVLKVTFLGFLRAKYTVKSEIHTIPNEWRLVIVALCNYNIITKKHWCRHYSLLRVDPRTSIGPLGPFSDSKGPFLTINSPWLCKNCSW